MRDFEYNEKCRYGEPIEFEKQLKVGITVTNLGETPTSLLGAKISILLNKKSVYFSGN